MSATRFLRPAPGLTVLTPAGTPLAPEGEPVSWSPYWQRRLRDGDVTAAASSGRRSPPSLQPEQTEE